MGTRLEAFWFRKVDPRAAGACRIAYAIACLITIVSSFPRPMAFYFGKYGLVYEAAIPTNRFEWSLLPILGPSGLSAFFWIALFSAVMCFVGWQTRFFALILWLWHLTVFRMMHALTGSHDQIFCAVDLCFLMIPCDESYSLAGWLRGKGEEKAAGSVCAPGLRMIQVVMSTLYLNSGLGKLCSPTWRSGVAIDAVLTSWFAAHPFHPAAALSIALGYAVILFEITVGFLVWFPRFQRACLAGALLFHAGVFVCTTLKPFSIVMSLYQVCFVFPLAEKWLTGGRRGKKLSLHAGGENDR